MLKMIDFIMLSVNEFLNCENNIKIKMLLNVFSLNYFLLL